MILIVVDHCDQLWLNVNVFLYIITIFENYLRYVPSGTRENIKVNKWSSIDLSGFIVD